MRSIVGGRDTGRELHGISCGVWRWKAGLDGADDERGCGEWIAKAEKKKTVEMTSG